MVRTPVSGCLAPHSPLFLRCVPRSQLAWFSIPCSLLCGLLPLLSRKPYRSAAGSTLRVTAESGCQEQDPASPRVQDGT